MSACLLAILWPSLSLYYGTESRVHGGEAFAWRILGPLWFFKIAVRFVQPANRNREIRRRHSGICLGLVAPWWPPIVCYSASHIMFAAELWPKPVASPPPIYEHLLGICASVAV